MRLYLFELGHVQTGEPILGYLVQTDSHHNVLIDTGYRPGTLGETPDAPSSAFLQGSPGQLVVHQLQQLGLSANDIHYVVITHLDPDHAGFTSSFPAATLVIQRSHLSLARQSTAPRFQLTRLAWDNSQLRFQEVDGDVELLPGIELIESSGHVTGHQSVLLRLPNTGAVLLPIDAFAREHINDPESRTAGPFDEHQDQLRQSTRKLIDLAHRENALIIYAHDPEQWPTLRHSPAFYD